MPPPKFYFPRLELMVAYHLVSFSYLADLYRNPVSFVGALMKMYKDKNLMLIVACFFHLLPYGILFGELVHALHSPLLVAILTSVLAALVVGIIHHVALFRAIGINHGMGLGILYGAAMVLGLRQEHELGGQLLQWLSLSSVFIIVLFRLYYLPLHYFLLAKNRPQWFRYHPVAWDLVCAAPFPGLDRILITYVKAVDRESGQGVLRFLSTHYPSQKESATRAWITIANQEARGK